ncbi:non-ribosomal peptide synthetase [Pelagibaculum spongiae]|uniref:Carrier domain-containing protein n=1 Tax=Pelagibaculum spongiae TaxID=2080658 RepID=A0A2V1GVD6_9GAMM|nr:non-ribosomal peptide synthetase [Pelagibaculum spongiae]PVZ68903.1 hypothetical protein DC094_11665 [Pelagibaculum spongiae]
MHPTPFGLIKQLQALGAELKLADGKLKLQAPKGVVTPQIAEQIKSAKQPLIDWLSTWQTGYLPQLIELQASWNPDNSAIYSSGASYSYRQLIDKSANLAGYLQQRGLKAGDRVAVLLDRNIDLPLVLYSIWRAGAVWLPLDSQWPLARQKAVLQDAKPAFLISHSELANNLDTSKSPEYSDFQLCLIDQLPQQNHPFQPVLLNSTMAAYLIYTSGSTGAPKGVQINHGAITHLFKALHGTVYSGRDLTAKKIAVNASVAFDASMKQLIQLAAGATIAPIDELTRLNPEALAGWLNINGVYGLDLTPSLARQLLPELKQLPADSRPNIMLIGGEAIDLQLWQQLARLEAVTSFNVYGPTEATVDTTSVEITENNQPCLGSPLPGYQVQILDDLQRPVMSGAAGELAISGVGLADGYINQPQLTAEKFIHLNHPTDGSTRWYLTGDKARFNHLDLLEYLGRFDDQIKLRGYRIELGEIEAALLSNPQIQHAAVLLKQRKASQTSDEKHDYLVGYYSLNAGQILDKEQCRKQLTIALPAYMLPQQLIELEVMPLTVNGKVDRKSLPEPEQLERKGDFPQSELQIAIAGTWKELLNLTSDEPIFLQDDFFALGGHSLLAAQLIARINRQHQINLPLRVIFESPQLEAFTQQISIQASQPKLPKIIKKVFIETDIIPLSFQQERLWFLSRLNPESAAFNMPLAMLIRGKVNSVALNRALQMLVNRHSILRSRFVANNGEGGQQIDAVPAQILHFEQRFDLADKPQEQVRLADLEALRSFDLESQHPIRARLIEVSDHQNLLLISLHHIASDGWSNRILLQQLIAFYQKASLDLLQKNSTNSLLIENSDSQLCYADYAQWQRENFGPQQLEKSLQYWQQRLSDAPSLLQLATDRPRPEVSSGAGALVNRKLDAKLLQQLNQFARQKQMTLFMLLLSAWQMLLMRHSGQDDLSVGVPVAGRSQSELEDLVGFFVNAVVMRATVNGNQSIDQFLEKNRADVLDAFEHQQVPVEMVLEKLSLPRSTRHMPLAQVSFSLQNIDDGEFSELPSNEDQQSSAEQTNESALSISPLKSQQTTARQEMTLFANEGKSGLELSLEYSTDIYNAERMEVLLSHFQAVLHQILENSQQSVLQIPLESTTELAIGLQINQPVAKVLPVTPMQRDLAMASLAEPTTLQNSLGYAIHIHGKLDPKKWQKSLEQIQQQFPLLSTRFSQGKQAWHEPVYQWLPLQKELDFQLIKLTASQSVEQMIQQLVQQQTFDIENGTLCKCYLLRVDRQHHVALLAAHHAVLDGIAIISHFLETLKVYQKEAKSDQPLELLQDPFFEWSQQARDQFDQTETLQFWQQQLSDVESLDPQQLLPNKTPAANHISKRIELDLAHWQAIKDFCRKQRITPALYMKGIYAIVLSHYCRSEKDFVLLENHPGRTRAIGLALGCFYHQAPSLVKNQWLQGTFSELLAGLRQFQKLSKNHLQISLQQQFSLLPAGKLQFMYNFQQFIPTGEFEGQQLRGTGITPLAPGFVQFMAQLDDDVMSLKLDFDGNLFDDLLFLQRFIGVSTQILQQSGQQSVTLANLRLILGGEKRAIQGPEVAKQPLADVQLRFEAAAAKYSNNMAVVCGEKKLSYPQLNQQSNQLAYWLKQQQIVAGDIVGICLPRCVEWPLAILGIIKAGAAYLPMDADIPQQRKQYLLQNSNAKLLIDDQWLEQNQAELQKQPSENLQFSAAADDCFYQVYTSGSTGQPKGAAVSRGNIANLHQWFSRQYQITQQDKSLLISAFAFDLTQKNLLSVLLSGGCLVMPETSAYDPQVIADTSQQHQITLINAAPSAFYPLIEAEENWPKLSSLRQLWLGGESITANRLLAWQANPHCHCQIDNTYGPTECSDITCFESIDFAAIENQPAISLGRPIDNLQLKVVDQQLRDVASGIAGELLIAGASLGQGYPQDPQKTAETFIQLDNKTWYRSGDLVRQWNDGRLQYLNRADFQIKLRGMRIEPVEIEQAILQLAAVSDVRVMVTESKTNPQLAAWLIGEQLTQQSWFVDQAWKALLAEFLPSHMIPSEIFCLEQWPLNNNGKVDRKSLLQMNSQQQHSYQPPQNSVEKRLEQLWGELLGQKQVSRNASFFDLGGQSLMAARMMARVRDLFAVDLPLMRLFSSPTIAAMAELIQQQQGDIEWSPLTPIQPLGDLTPIYLVHPIGAQVLIYQQMAAEISKQTQQQRPVFGLTAKGLEADQVPFDNVEKMAAFYIESIKKHQPEGPYWLGGQSMGGVVAYEMAQQLIAQGDQVSGLLLMDSYPAELLRQHGLKEIDDQQALGWLLGEQAPDPETLAQLSDEDKLDLIRRAVRGQLTKSQISGYLRVLKGFNRMLLDYQSLPLAIPTLLIRPEDVVGKEAGWLLKSVSKKARMQMSLGWDKLLGKDNLQIEKVAGGHESIITQPQNLKQSVNYLLQFIEGTEL